MRLVIAALAVIFAAGCGGSGGGGSTGGSLDGNSPFAVSSGIAWKGTDDSIQERTFDLSKDDYTCEQARDPDGGFMVSSSFFAQVVSGTISGPSLTTGHYPNDAGGYVLMYVQQAQGSHVDLHILGGTVDVEALDPNFKGTFSTTIEFDDGGSQTVSGSFDAPYCQP